MTNEAGDIAARASATDSTRLRLRRQRPRRRRAAEQRDELAAPHHSITSSASMLMDNDSTPRG
jgi:hypothetical protein